MKVATDLWVLTGRKIRETLRQPVWVIMGLSFPLVFLALFAPLLHSLAGGPGFTRGSVLDVFVPGMLVMLAYTNASSAGWFLLFELDSGVIERLRVTPVSRFALLMGGILRDVLAVMVPALVLIAIAIPFGFQPRLAGIAVLLVLLALVTTAIAAGASALALLLRKMESLSAFTNGALFPLVLLSGMMLPLSLAPKWMQVLAHFNPLYYAVEASRDLAVGTLSSPAVGEAFLVMGGLTVLAVWWATHVYRKAVS
jgi:ABC-2 type transport system permease protein